MGSFAIGLIGQYEVTLDAQGRFPVPARLRSATGLDDKPLLDGELVLARWFEQCLVLFPPQEWHSFRQGLSAKRQADEDYRLFSRQLYRSAWPVSLDKVGRILIPSHLLEVAKLSPRLGAVLIGMDQWIEIWNRELFQSYLDKSSKSYEDVAKELFTRNGPDRQ